MADNASAASSVCGMEEGSPCSTSGGVGVPQPLAAGSILTTLGITEDEQKAIEGATGVDELDALSVSVVWEWIRQTQVENDRYTLFIWGGPKDVHRAER